MLGDKALHTLDVVHAVKIYLKETAGICWAVFLVVFLEGLMKVLHSFQILLFFNRSIGFFFPSSLHSKEQNASIFSDGSLYQAYWCFQHQASVAQVDKAATWSSIHVFYKVVSSECSSF